MFNGVQDCKLCVLSLYEMQALNNTVNLVYIPSNLKKQCLLTSE